MEQDELLQRITSRVWVVDELARGGELEARMSKSATRTGSS